MHTRAENPRARITAMDRSPLQMPPDFNSDTLMLAKTTEYGLFHESRRAAHFAADLIANGTAQDIALAQRILPEVLGCQELDQRDPHYGNFYWMREDDHVEDLNAVEFVLSALIPMMIEHGDRLSSALHDQVMASIRLGLDEIRRLDVLVAYTNITTLDVVNTCLGGELLADAALAQRGYRKLAEWIAYTAQHGHPLEFNSPTYTSVTLGSLKQLIDLVNDHDTQVRAKAMSARLALSVALRVHGGTGRWAGPHGRAYQPTVMCETPPEIDMLRRWIAEGVVPDWIEGLLDGLATPFQAIETAERSLDLSLTTYQTAVVCAGHIHARLLEPGQCLHGPLCASGCRETRASSTPASSSTTSGLATPITPPTAPRRATCRMRPTTGAFKTAIGPSDSTRPQA